RGVAGDVRDPGHRLRRQPQGHVPVQSGARRTALGRDRSEEHTSELQSLAYLVCRLLLGKKKAPSRRGRPRGGYRGHAPPRTGGSRSRRRSLGSKRCPRSALILSFSLTPRPPPRPTLFPYTTLFRSVAGSQETYAIRDTGCAVSRRVTSQCSPARGGLHWDVTDRKSTRLNSSH